jgi:hypothetical protein
MSWQVTAIQLRQVIQRLIEAGQWEGGDLPIMVVADAGYGLHRLCFLLADLPIEILGRLRSDRVMHRPEPPANTALFERAVRVGRLGRRAVGRPRGR